MRKSSCEKKDTAKGSLSEQDDEKLITCMHKHEESSSKSLPQAAGFRGGNFGEDEEDLIIRLHGLLGDRWSLIAGRLPGRTGSEVKSYWNSHIRNKLIMMGHDPDKNHLNKISSTKLHAGKAVATNDHQMQATCTSAVNPNAIDHNNDFPSAEGPQSTMSSTTEPALNLDLTLRTPQFYPTESGREN